jgi:LytS/YehU family sensor histidine kinase
LPEALAELQIPPLLLQPLVENCIKHGLEAAIAGGRIEIAAARDGDDLLLRVRDTGLGLAASSPNVEPGCAQFGLAQVRERLATGGLKNSASDQGLSLASNSCSKALQCRSLAAAS